MILANFLFVFLKNGRSLLFGLPFPEDYWVSFVFMGHCIYFLVDCLFITFVYFSIAFSFFFHFQCFLFYFFLMCLKVINCVSVFLEIHKTQIVTTHIKTYFSCKSLERAPNKTGKDSFISFHFLPHPSDCCQLGFYLQIVT